ncbi:allantoinase PuuE [Gordonia sp. (in: high G+C Gram-positive bacteria)]|jgi:putative urate catabolism protein|uniref:allantoinase PuuE n=1 Tax=Gordonia sp. (in: high G+C Gram-positive bacteria) TaxID=84139 RepID=UPI001DCA3AE8|nr:allantoinase PuuE [Gordonia sp. (in: high G+C Gram-positive bacteria)]MCB1295038.1 allantoinase PuuE [Gordonia sp. (in: high G+C Gram-positive bacteria)]HQV17198.1 allantoinase PuuE [Gordonia sp. (in: high G+C Gram-positive bacteria)]
MYQTTRSLADYRNENYPRDMVGYGRTPPDPRWPGGAKVAVQFVLNYEEGAENNVLENDRGSETFLSEMVGAQSFPNRHMSMESLYEYGSRAGVWRVLRTFERRGLPLTIFAVAQAMARNPEVAAAFVEKGHEIACHGYRWLSYQLVDQEIEREHMVAALELLTEITGERPRGWYTGRDSPHTRRLVVEQGGFAYDSDSYADDLPYWVKVPSQGALVDHLVVPYTLDTNDMRFSSPGGFPSGEQFFAHLRDAFDVLYREGQEGAPKMLSVGLHCRLVGRPARLASLERFLDHVQSHDDVWITRRIDIADHWRSVHPAG